MRTCIKCKRDLSDCMFDDNWRHKVNICRDCKREWQRAYRKAQKGKRHTRLGMMDKRLLDLENVVRELQKAKCPKCGGTGVIERYNARHGHTTFEDCSCIEEVLL